jgi:hypothetical protein
MGRARKTHAKDNWSKNLRGRDHLKDLDVDGRDLKKLWCDGEGLINVVQDRAQRRALVNTVMNL